ncbi:MAG: hypothetical protein WCK90_03700 [archaeon]
MAKTIATPGISKGTLFWRRDIVPAYKLASAFAGKEGRVATMPDVIRAKAYADDQDPVWTNYITTTSGEFYGKSAGGVPIVVVAHGIDGILQDEGIMKRSMKNLRENNNIQLTSGEFRKLENGEYGPTQVVEHSTVIGMREFPNSVLSYCDAMMNDTLLIARLGPTYAEFLDKHEKITLAESKNDFIIVNDHKYPYNPRENNGGLLSIGQLMNCQRCGGEPSSVSSEIDVSDLSCGGRFIALEGKGELGVVGNEFADLFRNISDNWKKVSVPYAGAVPSFHNLKKRRNDWFTVYTNEDNPDKSGFSRFHVKHVTPVSGPASFKTKIGGYHGLLRYEQKEVRDIAPKDANAYAIGEAEIIWENGNPVWHHVPVKFYRAQVDSSRVILTEDEVLKDMGLVRKLLTA